MGDVGIIIQPIKCAATGQSFSCTVLPCLLKCGCVLSTAEVEKATTETGFVYCTVCEFAYNVKSKGKLLSDNRELRPEHIGAQLKRCTFLEEEIARIQMDMDSMIIDGPLIRAEEEESLDFISESDPSSVEDESDMDVQDFLSFDATDYARFSGRLKKLKARRDELAKAKKDLESLGKQLNAPWAKDSKWMPSDAELTRKILAKQERRKLRGEERQKRYEARQSRRGSRKVVHNVHVLDKNVPRKWRDSNPNAEPAADFEEKAREKQGWLTEQEQEDMDDDEQAATTEKRRDEWRAKQSKVPKIFGSVQRQRWAARLYKIARRRHYFNERIAGLTGTDEAQLQLWKARLDKHEANLVATQAKCAKRLEDLEVMGRYEAAAKLKALLDQATKIGEDEIAAEMEAKRKAEEAAAAKAAEEEAARIKAEEKAKAKAECEARGEVWKDPDAADEGDEGDDEE